MEVPGQACLIINELMQQTASLRLIVIRERTQILTIKAGF